MDPLSIVASVVAVFQAADRLGGLLGSVKPFLNAPSDVLELLQEVQIIRNALGDLQLTLTTALPSSLLGQSCLQSCIDACVAHISCLETLISDNCKLTGAPGGL